MIVSKIKLQRALEIVKAGLSNREIIEQATCFAFIDGKITTYNDEISLSTPFPELEITGAINADDLYQLLSKLKKDEIEVNISETEITLEAGRAKAGMILQSEIKLPLEELLGKKKWKVLPEKFLTAMDFVRGSASNNLSQPIITCVHVSSEGFLEASDSFRITRYNVNDIPVKTFLIPATSCTEVLQLTPTHIAEGKGWVHFKNEIGTTLSCRVFEDDKFPQTKLILLMEGQDIIFPKNSLEVLERASVFSKREHMIDEVVEIILEEKKLTIKSSSDTAWFEESLNFKYEGDPFTFMVTPYLLKGILSQTLNCTIGKDKLKFESEDWVYVTMLKTIKK